MDKIEFEREKEGASYFESSEQTVGDRRQVGGFSNYLILKVFIVFAFFVQQDPVQKGCVSMQSTLQTDKFVKITIIQNVAMHTDAKCWTLWANFQS